MHAVETIPVYQNSPGIHESPIPLQECAAAALFLVPTQGTDRAEQLRPPLPPLALGPSGQPFAAR